MDSIEELVVSWPSINRSWSWRSIAGSASAIALSVLFLASGIWKLLDPEAAGERMVQSLVPAAVSMPAALAVAVCESFAGVLLLIPRYRRWGAWIAGFMLVAFMIYIGALYERLLGEDCNCFPWIRRVVGPAFFAGDAAMLALAVFAGWRSRKAHGWTGAAVVLGCVCLSAGASYTLSAVLRSYPDAPEYAMVDGQRVNLRQGRFLLYFFDPECSHCYTVAQEMAMRRWGSTRVVILPTREERFASSFVSGTGLRAGISPDAEALRRVFPFTDPPYVVALEEGRVVATFNWGQMEGEAYYGTLARLGHLKEETP